MEIQHDEAVTKLYQNQTPRQVVSSGQCFVAAVYDCGFDLIDHLPYSPDLARSDYHLFSNIKNAWLETSITVMMMSYVLLMTFLSNRMKASSLSIQALQRR